jgi:hypothetical protein
VTFARIRSASTERGFIQRSKLNLAIAGCTSGWKYFRTAGSIAAFDFDMIHLVLPKARSQNSPGTNVSERLRLGVVGGGAVLERYHIPAINAVPEVVRSIVVDLDGERARRVAHRYGFPISSSELADVARHADVAIVLVPNGLHASVACELLAQGIHVLCEKPMARSSAECLAMIEASRRGHAKLCIGHNRRFQQHMKLAKQLIGKGLIGEFV